MNINAGNRKQLVFNGYDVMPLKGIYMQGLVSPAELQIFKEMKSISAKEGFDLFVNQNNHSITTKQNTKIQKDNKLSVWAQDNKAFIKNKIGKVLLWNSKEPVLTISHLSMIIKLMPDDICQEAAIIIWVINRKGKSGF